MPLIQAKVRTRHLASPEDNTGEGSAYLAVGNYPLPRFFILLPLKADNKTKNLFDFLGGAVVANTGPAQLIDKDTW